MFYASTKLPLTILTYLSTRTANLQEVYRNRPDLLIRDAWSMDYQKELFEQQLNNASPFRMPTIYVAPPDSVIDMFIGK